jgi:hypothetical protein
LGENLNLGSSEIGIALAEALSIPHISLIDIVVEKRVVNTVPQAIALKYHTIPSMINPDNNCLIVCMEDPTNEEIIITLEFVTGKYVNATIST